jgi:hypothetical protein
MPRNRRAHERGYENQSAMAPRADWRPLIVPTPDYRSPDEQALYESEEARIRSGESRSQWVERVAAMATRATLGPGADDSV